MATNPGSAYPTKTDNTDLANYPYGKAQNVSSPGAGDGTPWVALLLNDIFGFQQKLLTAAGIVPSGTPDNIVTSQYYDALLAIIAANPPAQATETTLGTAEIATQAEVDAGLDTTRYITPATLANRAAPYVTATGSNANGQYRVWSDGFREMWGFTSSITRPGNLVHNFPIAFTTLNSITVNVSRQLVASTDVGALTVESIGLTSVTIGNPYVYSGAGQNSPAIYHAKGY